MVTVMILKWGEKPASSEKNNVSLFQSEPKVANNVNMIRTWISCDVLVILNILNTTFKFKNLDF